MKVIGKPAYKTQAQSLTHANVRSPTHTSHLQSRAFYSPNINSPHTAQQQIGLSSCKAKLGSKLRGRLIGKAQARRLSQTTIVDDLGAENVEDGAERECLAVGWDVAGEDDLFIEVFELDRDVAGRDGCGCWGGDHEGGEESRGGNSEEIELHGDGFVCGGF